MRREEANREEKRRGATRRSARAARRRLLALNDLERKAMHDRALRREHARRATLRAQRLEEKLRSGPRAPLPVALEARIDELRALCAKNEAEVDYMAV